jgi:type IV pilus assembly protein PilC
MAKKKKGVVAVWIEDYKKKALIRKIKKQRIKIETITLFAQQLASMLDAGLPIVTCLEALAEQTSDSTFKEIIKDVRSEIGSGSDFSQGLRKYPNAFPTFFVNMVQAGEASGSLPMMVQKVANYYEDTLKLYKKVKSAMAYPAVVISLALILVNVLIIFVVPIFAEMFVSFGAELPGPTQVVINISDFLNSNIFYIIVALLVGWQVLTRYFKTNTGRGVKDKIIRLLPIVGPLMRKVAVSRFTRTYSVMMKSGVPILKCIDICSAVSNNTYIEGACLSMMQHVSQGGQVSEVIQATPYFPPLVSHMAQAGEKSGKVDEMMEKAAQFYDVEVNNTVNTLSTLIEPILIVGLGLIIGAIVIAMFMPVFELSSVVAR